ncbi:MAG: hypothetical protein E7123_03270 [Bacteroidales bacterium]|nr:hypothetical protein [Bacteroidales bacterium]
MKKIIILSAALFAAAALQAQNLDPTVEVSRVYEGKLIEVRKPLMEMAVPDSLYRFDLDFDYSVFDNPYRGSYEFNPYMMDMKPESDLQSPSQLYLRAGAGYTLHPVFDLIWSPDIKGAFSVDVYGMHRSYVGEYRPLMGHEGYKGYDLLSKAGADFGYDWEKVALDFGASYYGLAVKDFARKRSYNALDAYLSVKSKSLWPKHFMYDVSASYRYADDASVLSLTEHDFSLDASFGPSFNNSNKVFFDLGVEMNSCTCADVLDFKTARFYLVPHYVYNKGILHLDLGFRLSAVLPTGDKVKNQVIYPDLHMDVDVIRDAMRLYVNVGGGEKLNGYASLLERNHHVDLNYGMNGHASLMLPSVERISAELGFEGRISGFFSYNLRGGYSNYAYAPLDGLMTVSAGVMPFIGYSPYQNAYAALDWDLNFQNVRFDGTFEYNHVWGLEGSSLLAPSELTGDAEVLYNWRKRVYAGVDCQFAIARSNGNGMKVPGYADLGIYGEYAMNRNISFWLRGGNLLNMEIQRSLLFAEKGINFTAGICLNF